MAKDRNSFAKRQREIEKKRKADEKRQRRSQKKSEQVIASADASVSLAADERTVLNTFRQYLMAPGKMLCFNNAELAVLEKPLAQLTKKGMLVAEGRPGSYSLTTSGYAAMKSEA